MGEIDEFLDDLDAADRVAFEPVCAAVRRIVPEAEQGRSYGMPGWRLGGRPLLGVAATASHLAIYPFSPAAVAVVADELPARDVAKGTIRFQADAPLADAVLDRVLAARRDELAAG